MKLKVFLSSINNDTIKIDGKTGDSLTDIRLWLRDELEKIKMFDKDFLDIRINKKCLLKNNLNTCNLNS